MVDLTATDRAAQGGDAPMCGANKRLTGGTSHQGRPEMRGKGEEESYEPIVPLKAANRRARPAWGGGHGSHWRKGANKQTYRKGETWRHSEAGQA